MAGAAEQERINRNFTLRGPAAKLFTCDAREVLLDGGTRTGKTWAILIKAKYVADTYPESRQLIVRLTRKSLTQSVLQDWRNEILWLGHPAVSATATAAHQDEYRWPNGSIVYFAGLETMNDTASPILSTKWDRINIVQCEELVTKEPYELLTTRLSSFKTPYHQIIADCNPSAPSHWLNQRFSPGNVGEKRARFPFRHYDNPLFYKGLHPNGEWTREGKEYVEGLESTLTGLSRARFLENKWVAAEGQILENWDPRKNVIEATVQHDDHYGWMIQRPGQNDPIRVSYFTAGMDFGWKPDPGALQVWAYDSPRWHPQVRRFCVAEAMHLEWQQEQWVDLVEELWEKYRMSWVFCDPSDPENINALNIRLGKKNYRNAPRIAIKCPPIGGGHQRAKNHTAAIDLMREGLMSATGHVRTHYLRDRFVCGIDESLRRQGLPTCAEQEMESWVYEVGRDGTPTNKPSRRRGEHANALMADMYDQVGNFVRGFGRAMEMPDAPPRGTEGRLFWDLEQDRKAEKRKSKQRRKPWA